MIPKLAQKLQVILALGLALALIFCLGLLGFHLFFWQKIYPGIKVANVSLTGKTQEQAANLLRQLALKQEEKIELKSDSQIWEIPLAKLKFAYLPEETGRRAYFLSRTNVFFNDHKLICQNLKKETNLNFDYQIDQSKLKTFIAAIAQQIDLPPIPPSIQLNQGEKGSTITVQTGQSGKKLNQEGLISQIDQYLGKLKNLSFSLPIEEILPPITDKQAQATKIRAEKFLAKKFTLSYKENSWNLAEAQLINFLDFRSGFDEDKIASFTSQLAQSIDRPAQNALFNFLPAAKRVVEFKPAKDGQTLNQQTTKQLITQTLEKLEKEASPSAVLTLPVDLAKPAVANEDVNNLGIKELIGRGESWFSGSISSRIHNIQLASSQINGLLIAPGETFSLNSALGDVSSQTGYKQAWVIKEGRTVLDDGGGVCQVSTTLFRAILDAGLPVIERQAHAYRVGYYEQNYQVGVDATVFSPSPDLKFKNDTPGHILIQTFVDPVNAYAHYDLYGTADGRQVTISPSRIWDQTPPPPDLFQDDPTLPNGVIKQIDWSAWGAKVAFDWRVVRGSQVLQERIFYSSYKPWQAKFLRGTGP